MRENEVVFSLIQSASDLWQKTKFDLS